MWGRGIAWKNTFVAHWNAATHESLISFRYCTPLVTSVNMLGPVVSGPKHQIFLARSLSHPNFSERIFERVLGSSLGPTWPSSMASGRPSSIGLACRQFNIHFSALRNHYLPAALRFGVKCMAVWKFVFGSDLQRWFETSYECSLRKDCTTANKFKNC